MWYSLQVYNFYNLIIYMHHYTHIHVHVLTHMLVRIYVFSKAAKYFNRSSSHGVFVVFLFQYAGFTVWHCNFFFE